MGQVAVPSFEDALWVWARVAASSFGGPAGQIAVMHRILVEEKGWIDEERFLHALNYCMLLPGPEAQQLATYIGWLLHGTRGGLVAGGLFILPGFVSILALSLLYVSFQDLLLVEGIFFGLKAAVLAVVLEAVQRIGRRVLKTPLTYTLAGLAFVAIFCFAVPFPLIVAVSGGLGLLGARLRPGPQQPAGVVRARPSLRQTGQTALLWLLIWWVPVGGLLALLGPEHVLVRLSTFFSGAAMVTFGGAYAVLAYVAQQAVEVHGWLAPGEMLDGLGMAETTPGPLIQVVQFVGFMAAWRDASGLPPLLAGVAGAVVTTWVTFAPCFLWIFVGAPYVEWLRGSRALSAALSAITSAVVGVVLNLAVWFSLHVLFAELQTWQGPLGLRLLVPVWSSLDPAAAGLALLAGVALLGLHRGMLQTLLGAAGLGMLWRLLG